MVGHLLVNEKYVIQTPCSCDAINTIFIKKSPLVANDLTKDREVLMFLKQLLGVKKIINAMIIPILGKNKICCGVLIMCN